MAWLRWAKAAATCALLGLTTPAWHTALSYRVDDAFITYRYAYNLAMHGQFDYNLGQHVLATTSPLTALLLAPFVRLFGADALPGIANSLSIACLCALQLWIIWSARDWRQYALGTAAGILWCVGWFEYTTAGMETDLLLLLFGAAVLLAENRRLWLAGVMAGLAFLARGDGALALPIAAGLWWMDGRRLRHLWRIAAGGAAVLVPWAAFAWAYFGSPLPDTLAVKTFTGETRMFGATMWQLLKQYRGPFLLTAQPWLNLLLLAVLAVGLAWAGILLWRRRRGGEGLPSVLWLLAGLGVYGLAQSAAYCVLRVDGNYFWYYVPLATAMYLAPVLVGGLALCSPLTLRDLRWVPVAALAATLAVAGLLGNRPQFIGPQWTGPLAASYRQIAAYLEAHDRQRQPVALGEAGIIGYYAPDIPVFDYFGVVSPGWVLAAIRAREIVYPPPTLLADLRHERFAFVVGWPPAESAGYRIARRFVSSYMGGWSIPVYAPSQRKG